MTSTPGRLLRRALRARDSAAALAALERMRRRRYPPVLLRLLLSHCHPGLDEAFLDPDLVPAALLLTPLLPELLACCPVDTRRLALWHGDDLHAFVRDGLNGVLRGERPLLAELPAVPIAAYHEQLRHCPQRRSWLEHLSALECLALEARPASLPFRSALQRWQPSALDADLAPAWLWLELARERQSLEAMQALAGVRAVQLGCDGSVAVAGPQDCAALVAEAARAVLGRGARYLLWNRPADPPEAVWGDWIRGLAAVDGAPLLQLAAAPDGVRSQLPVQPCGEPSLLAIDARWLARRRPERVAGFLHHWLHGAAGRAPVRLGPGPRPWRGVLLLAVSGDLEQRLGLEELRRRARQRALDGGFDSGELVWLDRPLSEQWSLWTDPAEPPTLVAFIGPDDSPVAGAWQRLRRQLSWQQADLICSDEELIWCRQPPRLGLRQLEGRPTPFRLLTRGAIPGLVAIPAVELAGLDPAPSYGCLHGLLRDLALQFTARGARIRQLPEVLLRRDPLSNPAVLAFGAPALRQGFSGPQLQELAALVQRRGGHWLLPEGAITPGPLPGSFMVRRLLQSHDRISVLIPFRDQADLTRRCVLSLLEHAVGLPLELVLIDNGSTEEDAVGLAAELQRLSPVPVVGLRDERPFNFAALNNRARQLCSGSFLLFLNNDIVFRSARVIEQLLDPFGCRDVGAVGTRMLYGDGRIQHHGLMSVAEKLHDIQSPGKGLVPGAATSMLAALQLQEEWSAATAACLMVRAEAFDRIGGFDESFAVAYNDVDFCWRLAEHGWALVVTPEPRIQHLESHSRGRDRKGEKRKRLYAESARLRELHPRYFQLGDPLQHPLLDADSRHLEPAAMIRGGTERSRNRLVWTWRSASLGHQRGRPLLIYAHWDQQPPVRQDVLEQVRQYGRYADVVFVSACARLATDDRSLDELCRLCEVVLIRENEGYDFGSWKAGIETCWGDVLQASQLILTNDSCYGPVVDFEDLFQRLKGSAADVVGLTEVSSIRPHLQSYFIAYRSTVVRSPVFRVFWEEIGLWNDKLALVTALEVAWMAVLERLGFSREALYGCGHGNITHTHWRELIEDQQFPFIKKELLQHNPRGQEIQDWQQVVGKRNPELRQAVEAHLARLMPLT
ncbi:MAG: rhamnan synthesis F family protein [Cyanobacteria bacterium J06638_7]